MDFFSTSVAEVGLVSGLEWRALTDLKTLNKDARVYAKDLEAKLYVSIKSAENVVMCGFMPNEFAMDAPKKPHSLAVLLAGLPDVAKDCVLVIEDDEGATMAALLNGVPAPGFDGRGQTEDIVQAAKDFIRMAPQGVTVYGNCGELNPEPLALPDLVTTSTTLKQSQLRKLPTSPVTRVVILSIVILAIGGGAKYALMYQEELKKQASSRLVAVSPDVLYKDAVTPLFAALNPVVPSVTRIKEVLGPLSISTGGWELVEIACMKDGCSFRWQNTAGTNRTFVVPPQVKNMVYSPKGDLVTYSLAFAKPLATGISTDKLLSIEEVWRDVIGDFQQWTTIGVNRDFNTPADFGIPSGMLGTPSQIYKEGTYSISGPWVALDAMNRLPPGSTFDGLAISIDPQKHVTFKLSGKYYVH